MLNEKQHKRRAVSSLSHESHVFLLVADSLTKKFFINFFFSCKNFSRNEEKGKVQGEQTKRNFFVSVSS